MAVRAPSGDFVTFLFTDIESSTWLLQQLGDEYDAVLHQHNRLLREAWSAHDGFEVSTEGDAFFVTFDQPDNAIRAALDVQLALGRHDWPEDHTLRVRMGIHTGAARVYGRDYVGLAVHQAARIASAAHGGQVLVSESTVTAAGEVSGVGFAELGSHRLKDLAQPMRLFQLAHPELPSEFPPPRTLSVMPNNFPLQLTSFVGREDDIESVREALRGARLVTLTGAGGVGKTRLALQVGAELIDDFSDGAWLVDLSSLSDPVGVPGAIADALGVRDQPGRPITDTLVDFVLPRQLLVLLDNCEHLIDATAELAHRLLSTASGVKILATSREALNVPGESALRLRSLVLPLDRDDVDSLARTEAVRLFVQRARSARPGFDLDTGNAAVIAQICQRLDGLPLAIELAAARVRALGVDEIAERLDDRFRLLAGGSRTALPRQRTLEAAVAWSYELLAPDERSVFDRLSVFSGGCTLDAAELVCAGGEIAPVDVADVMSRLVEKSLVLADETPEGGVRYRLLETLRQFGRERLVQRGDSPGVRGRHVAWAVAFGERERDVDSIVPVDVREWENLRTALEWASEIDDMVSALRILTASRFMHFDEHLRWVDEVLPRAVGVSKELYGRALYAAGGLDFMTGRWASGVEHNRAAAEVADELGNEIGALWARVYEAACLAGTDEEAEARRLLRELLPAAREAADRGPYGRALLALSWGETSVDLEEAGRLALEGDTVSHELGSLFDIAHAREVMGYIRSLEGQFDEAGKRLASALRTYEEAGIVNCGAHCLETAAAWAAMTERFETGAELWGAAERIRKRTGDVPRPWERGVQERWLPTIRERLPADTFDAAFARGLATGWRDAVAGAEKALTGT